MKQCLFVCENKRSPWIRFVCSTQLWISRGCRLGHVFLTRFAGVADSVRKPAKLGRWRCEEVRVHLQRHVSDGAGLGSQALLVENGVDVLPEAAAAPGVHPLGGDGGDHMTRRTRRLDLHEAADIQVEFCGPWDIIGHPRI